MATRRHVLRICSGSAIAALAGCQSVPDSGSETPTAACSATPPPEPTDAATAPEPYPERPAELSKSAVESFLEAYEEAYRYNDALAASPNKVGRTNEITITVRSVSVTADGDSRFNATVTVRFESDFIDPATATTPTETPLPAGHGTFETAYVVTDRFLRREGVVVECW